MSKNTVENVPNNTLGKAANFCFPTVFRYRTTTQNASVCVYVYGGGGGGGGGGLIQPYTVWIMVNAVTVLIRLYMEWLNSSIVISICYIL